MHAKQANDSMLGRIILYFRQKLTFNHFFDRTSNWNHLSANLLHCFIKQQVANLALKNLRGLAGGQISVRGAIYLREKGFNGKQRSLVWAYPVHPAPRSVIL